MAQNDNRAGASIDFDDGTSDFFKHVVREAVETSDHVDTHWEDDELRIEGPEEQEVA